ncbi:prevent-host-death protein [Pedobacter riviphilus]|uniref:Prevent-host-death protein n=1 Tax=Pedobacter riviphilus TaxID=2766984 RepID=A0ABX6TCH0_9SPHI|nr:MULTISPECIES: prevent-host-death protein [Pedobacter]NII85237.1 hypothetical protein [Pedobacter sp. SG908]NMN39849.1 hypothetical protein [Pedobacter sp. SG918]QNR83189.1 prevent-host-death protein [Pedobacter riviphilus]
MNKVFLIVGVGIVFGYWKRNEIINYFVSKKSKNGKKRKIGLLDGKAQVIFRGDFAMTDEELLGLI